MIYYKIKYGNKWEHYKVCSDGRYFYLGFDFKWKGGLSKNWATKVQKDIIGKGLTIERSRIGPVRGLYYI